MRKEYDFRAGTKGKHADRHIRIVGDEGTSKRDSINAALALIFKGIKLLCEEFPHRAFTIDGRLVGDIGEVIAALEYDIELDEVCRPDHDGTTSDKRRVQVKATFQHHLTFKTTPDYYLGFKLYSDGRYEEVFNGPGHIIYDRYRHRKDIGIRLLAFPISELNRLSKDVDPNQQIPTRKQKRGD